MFPINTTMKGGCLATVPDVCKTPSPGGPVPVPYPNTGQWVQTIPVTASKKTKILNAPVVVANSKTSMSSGDEGGTAGGGVKSFQIKGPCTFVTYSQKLYVEGQPATYFGCTTQHNGNSSNTIGLSGMPPQNKVLVTM